MKLLFFASYFKIREKIVQSVWACLFFFRTSFANFNSSKKMNKEGFEPPILFEISGRDDKQKYQEKKDANLRFDLID